MKRLWIAALMLVLGACADKTVLKPATYAELSGWKSDRHAEALRLFVDSCRVLEGKRRAYFSGDEGPIGNPALWQSNCALAEAMIAPTDEQARSFFETYFTPVKVETESKPQGLFTGYYEPLLRGSKKRRPPYLTPVYGVPAPEYRRATRAEIEDGALKGHAPVLLWVDDPIMLFFLQTQGSGKVRLTDGSLIGLQYAGQNGYDYTPIGRILRDSGELETLSMQTIRDWLIAHPQRQREIMDQNESYVFFKLSPGNEMAKGAIGLPLTKLRSVAIDDDRAAYGVPTYIDTTIMDYASRSAVPLQRLFVSQDTGGALHGPHRGDLFFGRGTAEEWQAGHQNARGNAYWLVPSAPAAPTELPAPAIEPPVEPTLAADTPPPQAVAPVVVPATASQLAPIIVPKPAVSGR